MSLNVRRRKFIKLSSCFFVAAVVSSCAPKVIGIRAILLAIDSVVYLLKLSEKLSNDTAYSMNVSYQELGNFLNQNQFSVEAIVQMEKRYTYISNNAENLRNKLNETDAEANQMFALIKNRAKQNQTPELRKQMLSDINQKKKTFHSKMKEARTVLSKVDDAVQKYDDILGYIQVGVGLDQVDDYLNDVDEVISQGSILAKQIKEALIINRQIANSFRFN